MPTFPLESELLNAAYTKSQMQTVFANWLAACKQLPGAAASQVHKISGGVIAPSAALVGIDTEGGAATDDLTNIDYTNMPDGSELVLYQANVARAVTLKHLAGGNGQLWLAGGADRVLSWFDAIVLYRLGSCWKELSLLSGIGKYSTIPIGHPTGQPLSNNVAATVLTTSTAAGTLIIPQLSGIAGWNIQESGVYRVEIDLPVITYTASYALLSVVLVRSGVEASTHVNVDGLPAGIWTSLKTASVFEFNAGDNVFFRVQIDGAGGTIHSAYGRATITRLR